MATISRPNGSYSFQSNPFFHGMIKSCLLFAVAAEHRMSELDLLNVTVGSKSRISDPGATGTESPDGNKAS